MLVHVQDDKYWPTSIECQLLTGAAGDLLLTNPPAAKLTAERQDPNWLAAAHRTEGSVGEAASGEWNEMVIVRASIELAVNGTKVTRALSAQFTEGKTLQSEGAEVYAKDVVLKPLK